MENPNIVLITLDSLRADFVGSQNHNEKNTPFLDSFAQTSYVYLNAIAPGIPTYFYFPSVMTGTLPFTYGKYLGIPDTKETVTIAQVLKGKGYSTSAILADNPTLYSIYNYHKGFDHYDDGYADLNSVNKFKISLNNTLWKLRGSIPELPLRLIDIARPYLKRLILGKQQFTRPGRTINEKAMSLLNRQKRKPFFLWLHYMDTHVPYYSGLNSRHFFKKSTLLQRKIKKAIFFKELKTSIRKLKIENETVNEIFLEAYRSSVKYIDEILKELVMWFQIKYPNTAFIITSDHGEAFMEHKMYCHAPFNLYDELIKIPLLIHLPSGRHKKIKKTVSTLSIPKTICSLLGIKESTFLGTDIIRNNKDSNYDHLTRVLFKCRSPHVKLGILDNKTQIRGFNELWSYTSPEYKYILESNGKKEEFFDLKKDPFEKTNIRLKKKTQIKDFKKIFVKYGMD